MANCYDGSMEKVSVNFGAIDGLLRDASVSEIMVNHFDSIFMEREGKLLPCPQKFASESELLNLIAIIAKNSGREIDSAHPYMDSYLPDGSRVHAALPPMVPRGAALTIRKFRQAPFRMQDYIRAGTLSDQAAYFLHACVMAKINIVISGGTGTGKTSFLNALANLVSPYERIISIEDVAELNISLPNWVRLESAYAPGRPAITTRDCLINALRMRPDRIIVGECRRDETFEMLQAMNTGHDGSMTTVHANSARDCLTRLESLVMTSQKQEIPLAALRRQISSAVQLVVQLKRTKDGGRVVQEIVELTGMEQSMITSQVIFHRERVEKDSEAREVLLASGLSPTFVHMFSEAGVQLPQNFFDAATKITYEPD